MTSMALGSFVAPTPGSALQQMLWAHSMSIFDFAAHDFADSIDISFALSTEETLCVPRNAR